MLLRRIIICSRICESLLSFVTVSVCACFQFMCKLFYDILLFLRPPIGRMALSKTTLPVLSIFIVCLVFLWIGIIHIPSSSRYGVVSAFWARRQHANRRLLLLYFYEWSLCWTPVILFRQLCVLCFWWPSFPFCEV